MGKVEQDWYISSYDIGKKLNIDHKIILNHLEKAEYKKKNSKLGVTWFNSEKFLIKFPSANHC